MASETDKLAAVVVCFNPPSGLDIRLTAILQQADFLMVWDNASQIPVKLPTSLPADKVHLLRHEHNIGIAAALNKCLAQARAHGARYAVLFDHDSTPAPDMIQQLMTGMKSAKQPSAIAVPQIRYALPEIRCRWPQTQGRGPLFALRYADQMQKPEPVDLAISSGMLLNLSIWHRLGGFDESLFIDLVDTEYCLHARAHGHAVLACPEAQLQHSLGDVAGRGLLGVKVYPTHHSALRHYFINRNRWLLTRRYGFKFTAWLAYEWIGASKLFLKSMLFEPQRGRKLWAMLKGNGHGLVRMLCKPQPVRHAH